MLSPRLSVAALLLGSSTVLAGTAGSFAQAGNTLVSALLMFLGNEETVYIIDKAEGNAAAVAGHPAWGAKWDIASQQAEVMDIRSNTFCSSGMHLPNGSFINLGGNDGITINGAPGSIKNTDGSGTGFWDSIYQDFDGRKSIRILNPCGSADDITSPQCRWYDDSSVLAMKSGRWYAAVEPLGDGTIVILGGFTAGGYVNREFPVKDPITQSGQAQNTYEYYPPKDVAPPLVQFLVDAGGLNAYAHMFLMPSGNIFVQANRSSMLWDHTSNTQTPLPDMPNGVVRVYPASGGAAMLPLTPANNYTPTIIFCGGSTMPDDDYGNYGGPHAETWNIPASNDCQRITPEPQDGSAPVYVADDPMLETRTMGQFIILPDGTLLMINGGLNGTAGYTTNLNEFITELPFGTSLASGPVFTPAIFNPNAPPGSRWSNQGLSPSTIPRLYHSSAILLPDASVLVAGSNPNPDVNLSTVFNTEYRAEIFYPPYFSASIRPAPTGIPKTLSYGGAPFDITIPSTSYTGSSNDAADNTTVVVVRGGFTTHGMNMGQRFLQLNNTYTVNKDGSITLHVSQMPPIPNIFQPGPAFVYVNIHGIPSNGSYVIIGSGNIEQQPTSPPGTLPSSVRLDSATGGIHNGTSQDNGSSDSDPKKSSNLGVIIGAIAAGVAVVAVVGALIAVFLARRRRAAARLAPSKEYPLSTAGAGWTSHNTDSSVFVPLAQAKYDDTWDPRTSSINAPYMDERRAASSIGSRSQVFGEYDPYSGEPAQTHAAPISHSGYRESPSSFR
ncbi:Aldehyde oxidase GLOX [Psilocybe cubensis]|uniref:Aldehyde oxidase GLOX n=2 Tax=Psilocybe cubensis TaxID=181762 RepID=A0ACB8GFC2_PSICU|nr:Aldehyde oxidase GLOX [Psilocybe cubensis]KAH9474348.1 Aldehyde oxidase GLOX [Psilocybe cubensis]